MKICSCDLKFSRFCNEWCGQYRVSSALLRVTNPLADCIIGAAPSVCEVAQARVGLEDLSVGRGLNAEIH